MGSNGGAGEFAKLSCVTFKREQERKMRAQEREEKMRTEAKREQRELGLRFIFTKSTVEIKEDIYILYIK